MKEYKGDVVPQQQKGNEVTVEYSICAPSQQAAKIIFKEAVSRLLNVNEWHSLTGSLLSVFQITDSSGHLTNRHQARLNDYFRIKIPAPGSQAGDGYDWVKVEMIDHQRNLFTAKESVTMRVRPVASPVFPEAGTAHFFKDEATSTFKVLKIGTRITAAVYGRNEIPNTEADSVLDTLRNTSVAIGAILGGSRIQWESLVKGILSDLNNS